MVLPMLGEGGLGRVVFREGRDRVLQEQCVTLFPMCSIYANRDTPRCCKIKEKYRHDTILHSNSKKIHCQSVNQVFWSAC